MDIFKWKLKMRKFVATFLILCFRVVSSEDIEYELREEQPAGTYIGNIAINADLTSSYNFTTDDLQNMEYRFLSQSNPHSGLFRLDEMNSSLYTAQEIDREDICQFLSTCNLSLDVIARTTTGTYYQKIKIKITILDINDNSPEFPSNNLELEVSEASLLRTSFQIEGALDRDAGVFSVRSYSVLPTTAPFSISYQENVDGSSTVKLVLEKALDREIQDVYIVQVIAKDGGNPPKFGVLNVTFLVSDTNDNSPVFTSNKYEVNINEDVVVNSTIVVISATDADAGDNGKVFYSLSSRQDDKIHQLFAIDSKTGELRVIESLIYEPGESYSIIVEASDSAKQSRISQTQVTVHINDTHNNPPHMTVDLLSNTGAAKISEHAEVNSTVAHITISDPDTGLNGVVGCAIASDVFTLQKFDVFEYRVVLVKTLDREKVANYSIVVTCKDAGIPSMNVSSEFEVQVIDENDFSPKFTQKIYYVSVPENTNVNVSLLEVKAVDFDVGKNSEITYKLQKSGYNFYINPQTGVISANFNLDREEVNIINLNVQATDSGNPSRTGYAEIMIEVKDVNDNSPQFKNDNFEFPVPENFERSVSIGVLVADDLDEGVNKMITYSILQQDKQGLPFEVLSNGTIVTTGPLDRENTSNYTFRVVARDGGIPTRSTSARVTVEVLDLNDNNPMFIFPNENNRTVILSYKTHPNMVITQLKSIDYDEGLNAKVTYFMTNKNLSKLFQMNSLSGRIILMKSLTKKDVGKYTFGVFAQDKGTPPKITDGTLTIIITDQDLGDDMESTADNHRYYLIAVAVSCVTVVIAIVIILTICLIQRADRLKAMYRSSVRSDFENDDVFQHGKKVTFPAEGNFTGTHALYSSLGNQVSTVTGQGLGQHDVQYREQAIPRPDSRQRKLGTSKCPSFTIPGGDNNSENSREVNVSDSGRGGSEDLNNSSVLSISSTFDHSRKIPHRYKSSISKVEKANNTISTIQTSDSKLSIHDHVSDPEMTEKSIYLDVSHEILKYNSNSSQTGNDSIFTGQDGSSTTSGSYVLEPEDEYLAVLRPNKDCIV